MTLDDTRPLLCVEDVMNQLRISRTAAYRLMKSSRFRTVRIGRSIRVRPADLERFINVNEP